MSHVSTSHKKVEETIQGLLKGGCSRGVGNWGTLRIPREDWGTLGNIREDYGNHHPGHFCDATHQKSTKKANPTPATVPSPQCSSQFLPSLTAGCF